MSKQPNVQTTQCPKMQTVSVVSQSVEYGCGDASHAKPEQRVTGLSCSLLRVQHARVITRRNAREWTQGLSNHLEAIAWPLSCT